MERTLPSAAEIQRLIRLADQCSHLETLPDQAYALHKLMEPWELVEGNGIQQFDEKVVLSYECNLYGVDAWFSPTGPIRVHHFNPNSKRDTLVCSTVEEAAQWMKAHLSRAKYKPFMTAAENPLIERMIDHLERRQAMQTNIRVQDELRIRHAASEQKLHAFLAAHPEFKTMDVTIKWKDERRFDDETREEANEKITKRDLLINAIERSFAWYSIPGTSGYPSMKPYNQRIRSIALNAAKGIVPGAKAMENLDKLRPDPGHAKLPQWIREALAWKMPLDE